MRVILTGIKEDAKHLRRCERIETTKSLALKSVDTLIEIQLGRVWRCEAFDHRFLNALKPLQVLLEPGKSSA
jgi:hypothetical protein